MQSDKQYYIEQLERLNKLGEQGELIHVKLTRGAAETNYMYLNDECKAALLEWLTGSVSDAKDDSYNGWPNRETWAAYTWLTNEESWYREVKDMGVNQLKAWAENCLQHLAFDLHDKTAVNAVTDIGSMWRVNWQRIAAALSER